MLEGISKSLGNIFNSLLGKSKITGNNIQDALKELKIALIEADVNLKVVNDFTEGVLKESIGQKVIENVKPQELFIKIAFDKMKDILGNSEVKLNLKPTDAVSIIIFIGLQGSGKTTTAAKLAYRLKTEGKRPLLVACDLVRPAAIDQLEILAGKIEVPIYLERDRKDAKKIALEAIKLAKKEQYNVVLIDTAGRLEIDRDLISELRELKNAVSPDESIFVSDSMGGQKVADIASGFDRGVGISSVILTKFDSDTRGGAALSIKEIVKKPIKFIGVGEKTEDLEVFYPERIASRIMGMGDIISLVEKAQSAIAQEDAKKLEEKMLKKGLNLEDYLEQFKQIKKMGNIKSLIEMMPGASSMDLNSINEDEIKREEAIILSMTREERIKPHIIGMSRRKRIANGSGSNLNGVARLLKNFDKMNSMMKKTLKNKESKPIVNTNKKKKKRK